MGHYYTRDGKPRHTVIGKNGKERATTIRDARNERLLPSATTVLAEWANPDFEAAKLRKALCFVHDNPHYLEAAGGVANAFAQSVKNDAFKDWNASSSFGTLVHDAIEKELKGEPYNRNEVVSTPTGQSAEISVFVDSAIKALREHCGEGATFDSPEHVVVNLLDGYAGTIDLPYHRISERKHCVYGIADFKTIKTVKDEPILFKNTHLPQIAAYWEAHYVRLDSMVDEVCEGLNVYISTTEIGRVEVTSYTRNELVTGKRLFDACNVLWRHEKDYDPTAAA